MSNHRIAIGAIFTESNHLVGARTDLACFERTELRRGPEILAAKDGVVGGMLSVLAERQADVVPLLVATAVPGGPLTRECYHALRSDLLQRLVKALPLDGVLLPLHGAAAAEDLGDLEGDLLAEVRRRVGPALPLVATLDLHAHVTEAMIRHADAVLAWETYPHADTYTTGARGARMLLGILDGKVKPAMAMAKVPVIVGALNGNTEGPGPFADVMRFAKSLERRNGVLSTSAFLVHPYLDTPGMGGGGLVITDGDIAQAVRLATEIARMYWERRFDLEPELFSPAQAIEQGLQLDGGPLLLLEVADTVGGGATGDSVATLQVLLDAKLAEPSLAMVVDPDAASRCHQQSIGSEITLTLGHKLDPRWGNPISVTGHVEKLSSGKFVYSGGIWGGQVGDMGPSAKFKVGAVEVLIASHPTYDWADEQYRLMEMDTGAAKFIVVKNPMNYRIGYAGKYQAAFVLDTPGPTPPTVRHVEFKNLARPYYPADSEIPNLRPLVIRHEPLS